MLREGKRFMTSVKRRGVGWLDGWMDAIPRDKGFNNVNIST